MKKTLRKSCGRNQRDACIRATAGHVFRRHRVQHSTANAKQKTESLKGTPQRETVDHEITLMSGNTPHPPFSPTTMRLGLTQGNEFRPCLSSSSPSNARPLSLNTPMLSRTPVSSRPWLLLLPATRSPRASRLSSAAPSGINSSSEGAKVWPWGSGAPNRSTTRKAGSGGGVMPTVPCPPNHSGKSAGAGILGRWR